MPNGNDIVVSQARDVAVEVPAYLTDDAKALRAPYALNELPDSSIVLDPDRTLTAVAKLATKLAQIRKVVPIASKMTRAEREQFIRNPQVGDATILHYIVALQAFTTLCVEVGIPGPDQIVVRRLEMVLHDLQYERVVAPELKVTESNSTPKRLSIIRSAVAAAVAALVDSGMTIDDAGRAIERQWPDVERIAVRKVAHIDKASPGWKKAVHAYEQISGAHRKEVLAGRDPFISKDYGVSNYARRLAETRKLLATASTDREKADTLIYCVNLHCTAAASWLAFEPHTDEAN